MKKSACFIPPHGNYRQLLSYRKARRLCLISPIAFVSDFLAKSDRTINQMIQGARSGKQNILEGSKASGTSKETEIKLMGVARASLEELLGDYGDALRVRPASLGQGESRGEVCSAIGKRSSGRFGGSSVAEILTGEVEAALRELSQYDPAKFEAANEEYLASIGAGKPEAQADTNGAFSPSGADVEKGL
jgi:hypothetical protein